MDASGAHSAGAAGAPSAAGGQAASNEAQAAVAPPAAPVQSNEAAGPAPTTLSHFTAARARAGTGSTLTSRGRGLRVSPAKTYDEAC